MSIGAVAAIFGLPVYAVADSSGSNTDIPVPPVMVTIPGPTITLPVATITLPAKTMTVRPPAIPVPTKLITLHGPVVVEHSTNTVTAHSEATKTILEPSKTKTVFVTKVKTHMKKVVDKKVIIDHNTVIKRILLTTLLSVAFTILGFIGFLFAYWLGRKDAERDEKKFLGNLLDTITYTKKH